VKMGLTTIDLVNGILSLIFIAIATIVGLKVVLRYVKTKKTTPLYIGIAWIIIVSPWWGSATSVLVALATGGDGLSLPAYLLIANFLSPFFMVFLMAGFTNFYFKEKQKIIVGICLIIEIIFEIYLIFFIIVDPRVHGELNGVVDISYAGIWRIYLIIHIILILIIGTAIAVNSIKSQDTEIKFRGIFLLLAFISFTIGAIADASLTLNFVTLLIIRIILISSALEFYLGFIMPDWIKNILIKEK